MPSGKFLILFIIIEGAAILTNSCKAQSAADAYRQAEIYYGEGYFNKAVLEAKRACFFSDSLKIPGYLLLSDCFDKMENWEKAAEYLSAAAKLERNDSLRKEILFRKINLYLRKRQPAYAFIALSDLSGEQSVHFDKKREFYEALAYFQIGEFETSKNHTERLLKASPGFDSCYINHLYREALKTSKDPSILPPLLSAVMPGLGQFSLGYYREGLNTFMLNALIASVTIITLNRVYPLDAIITMFPFVRRYYLSGIFTAKDLTRTKQERKNTQLYNELLDYIDLTILHN